MKSTQQQSRPRIGLAISALLWSATLSAQASLVHLYEFNGNLNDSVGSLALISNGGTIGATSLTFGVNEGPTLDTSSVIDETYSIGLRFSLDTVAGYRKLIDFKDRGSDYGQYNNESRLEFYPVVTGPDSFAAGETINLVVTRDASTSTYTTYLNSVPQYSFVDGSLDTVAVDGLFHFFQDDTAVTGEASSGVVHEIRVWNNALSASEVSDAFAPVPEPSTYIAGAMLLLPLGAQALRFLRSRGRSA